MTDVNIATVIDTHTGEMNVVEVPYSDDIRNAEYLTSQGYTMNLGVSEGRAYGFRDGVKYEFIFGV